jgi:hypothetical protein
MNRATYASLTGLFLVVLAHATTITALGEQPTTQPALSTSSPENAVLVTRKAPYLIYPGNPTEMQVLWQLNSQAGCTIEWGTDTTYGLGSAQSSEYGVDHQHSCTITGLTPGIKYYYRVTASTEVHTGSFLAAPAPDATSVKFMAFGDTRTDFWTHDIVAEAMISTYTDDPAFQSFVLFAGDYIEFGDHEPSWDLEFFNPLTANILERNANLPLNGALGNHELWDNIGGHDIHATLFKKYFPYPFVDYRYWSFDYGPAHFVMIDQYPENYAFPLGPGSTWQTQLAWIEADLAATTKPWKFLCFHEPGWSAGHWHPSIGNNIDVQQNIQPLCEQYGVSMVIAGHMHYYARAMVNEVPHITTGGGGAPLTTPNPAYPNVVVVAEEYHYCKIEIDGENLHFTAVNPQGLILDEFVLSVVGVPDVGKGDRSLFLACEPNPSTTSSRITYELPGTVEAYPVRLSIYDPKGRMIRTFVDAPQGPGVYSVIWDGKDHSGGSVGPGVYFYRLQWKDRSESEQMVRVR